MAEVLVLSEAEVTALLDLEQLLAALAEGHPLARVASSFEEAVAGADVVCCCTDARQPVLAAGWLAPGAHVSSVGGTFGPELDPATVRSGRIFVEWRGAV